MAAEQPKACPFLLSAAASGGSDFQDPPFTPSDYHNHGVCLQDRCQMWGSTYTIENICVSDCRLIARAWVREV